MTTKEMRESLHAIHQELLKRTWNGGFKDLDAEEKQEKRVFKALTEMMKLENLED